MIRRAGVLVVTVSCAFALLLCACSGTTRRTPTPRPRPAPVVLSPRDDYDAARAVPLEVAPVDPKAEEVLRAHLKDPVVDLVIGKAPAVTLSALEATARGEAKGAEPDGEPRVVELREGQRATMPLPLVEGDCVTVIVHGGLGVMEVDAFLVAPGASDASVSSALTVLTQDTRTGPLAILGGQRGCFLASPRQSGVELWVQARRGAGPVVVGVYRVPRPG